MVSLNLGAFFSPSPVRMLETLDSVLLRLLLRMHDGLRWWRVRVA